MFVALVGDFFVVVVAVSHRPPLDFSGISRFLWPWRIPSRWVSGNHRKPSRSPTWCQTKEAIVSLMAG